MIAFLLGLIGLLAGIAIGIYYEVRHDAWWVIRSVWADFNEWRKG